MQYATPAMAPMASSCTLSAAPCWCAAAKMAAEAATAAGAGIHRVSDASSTPRYTVSSKMGASTQVASASAARPGVPPAAARATKPVLDAP